MTEMEPNEIKLKAWIEECLDLYEQGGDFEVCVNHKDELLLLFGMIARTLRFSSAYLLLLENNMEAEAVPLARSALEHAVTVQWVFTVDGGVNRFQREISHDRIEHYSTLAKLLKNSELHEKLHLLEEPLAGKRMPKFMDVLRDLDQDKFLESSYLILSQQVHVTHSAVSSFLANDGKGLGLQISARYDYRYQATYVVAAACMLALWVLARLTSGKKLLDLLDKKSEELVLPMNLLDSIDSSKRRKGI